MTFTELRDSAHSQLADRPDEAEVIASRYTQALFIFSPAIPPSIIEACLLEFWMRFRYYKTAPVGDKHESQKASCSCRGSGRDA